MIDILKTSDTLCKTFLEGLLEENNAEVIIEVLLEGRDSNAQKHCARVIKYLLCKMKMLEKEDVRNDTKEKFMDSFTDTDGNK